jgi:hypothetical protein
VVVGAWSPFRLTLVNGLTRVAWATGGPNSQLTVSGDERPCFALIKAYLCRGSLSHLTPSLLMLARAVPAAGRSTILTAFPAGGIVNLSGRGMLLVSVARQLGSGTPLLAYCADPLKPSGAGKKAPSVR